MPLSSWELINNKMKLIKFLSIIILFTSCKKNNDEKIFTVEGQILESSSDPIPVSNYTLSFFQKSNSGLLGAVSGLDTTTKTGIDGKFIFKYSANKNYGLSQGGTNTNLISIEGSDTINYKGLISEWYSISPAEDVNLHTIYLFKKIQTLVRKVQFDNALNIGETLQVITTDSTGSSYKNVIGPISAGTLVVVDTITNCKISRFDLLTNKYTILATLQKPSYQKELNIIMDPGDETYREIIINY